MFKWRVLYINPDQLFVMLLWTIVLLTNIIGSGIDELSNVRDEYGMDKMMLNLSNILSYQGFTYQYSTAISDAV